MAQSRTIGNDAGHLQRLLSLRSPCMWSASWQPRTTRSLFATAPMTPPAKRDYFRTLASKQADGIICISGLRRLDGSSSPHGIPVVCIDRAPENDLGFPHVGSDNIGGGYMATEHLIERGCRTS